MQRFCADWLRGYPNSECYTIPIGLFLTPYLDREMVEQYGFNFNSQPNKARDITLLIGICSGIASDGILTDGEISFLRTWLSDHKNIRDIWPADQIVDRLSVAMMDGVIAQSERNDLLELISRVARNDFAETGASGVAAPEMSIIPNHQGEIDFTGSFCFTGNFAYGTRDVCHFVSRRLGAEIHRDVTQKTNYLIIGEGHNPDWKHGAFGSKIERAMRWQQKNTLPITVHERTWIAAIEAAAIEKEIIELRAGFRNPKKRSPTINFNEAESGSKFASGWVFKVHDAFRPALDICFVQSDKKAQWEEGDPPIYRFNDHDQFTSVNGEKFIIHINQAGEDRLGEFGEIVRGVVFFTVFGLKDGQYQSLHEISCSNLELVSLLQSGRSEKFGIACDD